MFEGDSGEVLAGDSVDNPPNLPVEANDYLNSDSVKYAKGSMSTGRLNSPKSPSKMLSFSPRSGTPSGQNAHRVLFSQTPSLRRKATVRVIPTIPERVLDAPGIIDDYYLNLLDWSASNLVGIALEGSVFVWNASSGESEKLFTLQGQDSYVAAVSFSGTGQYMAVGTHDQLVRIWDVEAGKMVRTLTGHSGRVGSLSWNEHLISSGSRDALINTHDSRIASSRIRTFEKHSNEVCGLKWSPDGSQLASGSNDNTLNVWSLSYANPIYTFEQHNAAVKALAWCPWQRNLLASGGGTADKTIKFWSTSSGTCLHSIDTKSQVCSLQWSKHVKELVSSHGFSQNQLAIWKYPTMVKQAELTGHANRVLHTAMSPDGTTVVSASADETLRFWRVFDVESALSKLPKSHSEANLRRKMLR
jgi:cell division cycle protein 20 (cofactor of APC complex)